MNCKEYYIPNITIPKARRTGNIGKYRRLKRNYMKKLKCKILTFFGFLMKNLKIDDIMLMQKEN